MSAPPPVLEPLEALPGASRAPGPPDLGIVMTGGGARAAYQVGFLRTVARRFPNLRIPYVTGVSAGAINAALLASHHGTFLQAVQELSELWGNLTAEDVFRTDTRTLAINALQWFRQLTSGGIASPRRVQGLVDTQPLRQYLSEVLHCVDGELTGIRYNLDAGRLSAVAISTTSYTTGRSVTWIQGKNVTLWERPYRKPRLATITLDHVMASAALPLFFPAVQIENAWYGDGGIRLLAPLSPAVHLGARRIIAISTRYVAPPAEADEKVIHGYPPPAQVMGVLMNSIFLDLLDHDAMRLERLNRLVAALPEESRNGLGVVKLLTLRPSADLAKLAGAYEKQLPRGFRFLTRGLGTRQTRSPDFLSLILFQPEYLRALIDLGERDAEERAPEIEAFLGSEC
ncbi:MAG TPA: patatin-like phospholipase family protein [Longimicrobiales bacterium]|nr:patatin-like phospholipase family protein [Longimicrobiales bacterium]